MPAITAPVRQLDIISDTALAREYSASSSMKRDNKVQCFVKRAAKTGEYSASSSVKRVEQINRARKSAGLSHDRLCQIASVSPRNWFRVLRGEQTASPTLLDKLDAALSGARKNTPPQIVAGFHRLVMQQLALHLGFDVPTLFATDFKTQRPFNALWLQAARIRQMATYITAVELEVENVELARALGETRENVRYARNQVENRRDDGNDVDIALTAVTLQVRA